MDYEGGLHENSIGSLREAISMGANIILVTRKVGSVQSWHLFMQC